jgi:hypothetical protein
MKIDKLNLSIIFLFDLTSSNFFMMKYIEKVNRQMTNDKLNFLLDLTSNFFLDLTSSISVTKCSKLNWNFCL